MTDLPSVWHPLRAYLFIYYEVYVNAAHRPVAWISRRNYASRYEAFYCDGKHKASAQRGSMVNARAFIATQLRNYGMV